MQQRLVQLAARGTMPTISIIRTKHGVRRGAVYLGTLPLLLQPVKDCCKRKTNQLCTSSGIVPTSTLHLFTCNGFAVWMAGHLRVGVWVGVRVRVWVRVRVRLPGSHAMVVASGLPSQHVFDPDGRPRGACTRPSIHLPLTPF